MRFPILPPIVLAFAVLGACAERETSPTAPSDVAAPRAAAVAAVTRTEFAGFIHFCESTPPEEERVTRGGFLIVKGSRNRNQWVTGNPLIDGSEENVVNGRINLATGTGRAQIRATLSPNGVEGTWKIKQTLEIRGGRAAGSTGVGHGMGELRGMTIRFTTEPGQFGQNACNPNRPSARVQGVITSPATLNGDGDEDDDDGDEDDRDG